MEFISFQEPTKAVSLSDDITFSKMKNGKKSQKEAIDALIDKWGYLYDYSITKYNGRHKKIKYICSECGVIEQQYDNHLISGCPKCSKKAANKKETAKWEDVVSRAVEVHGDLYDYSQFKYERNNKKSTIICEIHGPFEKSMANHIYRKQGCPKCSREKMRHEQQIGLEEFLKKERKIHGDKYVFPKELSIYVNVDTPIKFICPKCGIVEQTPHNHLKSKIGCPKCSPHSKVARNDGTTGSFSKTEYFKKVDEIHNSKYIYLNKEDFVNQRSILNIKCASCGNVFKQQAGVHLMGCGCPNCAMNSRVKKLSKYSYVTKNGKVLYGATAISKYFNIPLRLFQERLSSGMTIEEAIKLPLKMSVAEYRTKEILDKGNVSYIYSRSFLNVIKNIKNIDKELLLKKVGDLNYMFFDFIILDKKTNRILAFIELDGAQHFRWIKHFSKTKKDFLHRASLDDRKNKVAKVLNIPFLRVRYDQFDNLDAILLDFKKSVIRKDGRYLTRMNPYLSNTSYYRERKKIVRELTLENA